MTELFEEIGQILREDPGHRGLAEYGRNGSLEEVTAQLLDAQRVLVVTGFAVPEAGIGETDGPGGAANIARLLSGLGKEVTVVTDIYSQRLLEAACGCYAPLVPVLCVPQENAREFCRSLIEVKRPTHVICIERPGMAADGHYHNMRGKVIDAWVADTELLCTESGAVTICVGDGGNELGMGACRETVLCSVSMGELVCAEAAADYPLVSGVSNWWGWGLEALLSVALGKNFLPTERQERELLRRVCAAGAVDGVTRRQEESVDGLSPEQHFEILRKLRMTVNRGILSRSSTQSVGAAVSM